VSLHLFVGGTWDGQVVDVVPTPYVQIPVVQHPLRLGTERIGDIDLTTHLSERRRWMAAVPHPCVRDVRVVHEWSVFTYGNVLGPVGLAGLPKLPPDRTEWFWEGSS
jgi:hypothetical protein